MSFAFRVAWRFLKSDKKQTLLIILGIAIGISVQIFVGLLIDSLQISLVNSTVGNSAHITIDSNETYGEVENYQEISSEVVKVDGVKFVVPSIDRVSNIQNFSDTGKQIIVKGWDLDQANDIYNLYNDKFTGAKPTKINETLIGTKLAEDFDISPGELLNFSMPNNYDYYTMKVVGIFDLGVASLNENWVITNNETIYAIYKPGNNATSINIQVEDVFQADIIAQTIREEVDIDQDN